MEPGELLTVKRRSSEIDRHELRRGGRFGVEHRKLLTHVAVNHTHDRRNTHPPAQGQRDGRPDVAEEQDRAGPSPLDQTRQPPIESLGAPPSERALDPGSAGGTSPFQPQGQVEAGDRVHGARRDFRIMATRQNGFHPGKPARGQPAGGGREPAVGIVVTRGGE
jgi:hypothetical protein